MSKIDWLDIATKCFALAQIKEMHVNDMAKHGVQAGLILNLVPEDAAKKLSAALGGNIKRLKNKSQFLRVKNKSGGFRQGIYRIKNSATPKLMRVDAPSVITGFTGKAGENAVLSELLFRGYNASSMAVDQGIDIVASKNNKYFHIQVKTANGDDSRPYTTAIRREAFQHSSDTFYIIVMRRAQRQRYINDYLVLSSRDIHQYVRSGQLKDGSTISLRLTVRGDRFLLNGTTDLTHCINDFDSIC